MNYDGNGNVMAYHAIVNDDGSTTEHTGLVSVAAIPNRVAWDGSTDPDTLILTCPICGATGSVPLLGTRDAQYLHAQVRNARGNPNPLASAIQSVIADVQAKNGPVLLTPNPKRLP